MGIDTADNTPIWPKGNRLVGYDPQLRRLWVGGQRLPHGATGIALAGLAVAQIATRRTSAQRGVAYLLAGAALSAHDWHDRSVWFKRGDQSD